MHRKATILILVALILLGFSTLWGQPATGVVPFGSFSGGPFDVVNNGNLNVHFEIPIINKAGRGLPFTYKLTYDSSVWYSSGAWTPVANWGWSAVTAVRSTGYITYYASPNNCTWNGQQYNWTVYAGFQYHDWLGVAHSFQLANGSTQWSSIWSSQPPCVSNAPPSTASGTAVDGSGYYVSQFSVANNSPSTTAVEGPNGTQYNAAMYSYVPNPQVTDRNGNYISATSGSTPTFTDTLGLTALTVSGSGTPSSPTKLTYTNPSAGNSSYTINYTAKTVQTAFGCSGVTEYGASSQNLITSIALPDGSSYSFTYETTPGHSPNVTGRLASVTLPTGGTISYSYTGGSNGITCADGTAATLNRTTPDSATAWVYTHKESGCTSPNVASTWCTSIEDPSLNFTYMGFVPAAPSGGLTNGYEVERLVNQGASSRLQQVDTCYNAASLPCLTTPITTFPFTQVSTRTIPGGYTLQGYRTTIYNSNGLPQTVYEYDWGNAGLGSLLRQTNTLYASLGNNIIDMPSSVSVYTGTGTLVAQTNYFYDQTGVTTTTSTPQHISITGSRGNLTTIQYLTSSSTYLTQTNTFYDTGNVKVFTDVNNGQITYTYNTSGTSCTSSLNSFLIAIAEPLSLSRSYGWDCTGYVMTSATDENSQVWSAGYTDAYYWRPTSTRDPASATTNLHYYTGPFATESTLNFNGTVSTVDTRTTLDGLGRTHVNQRQQTQSGANYDSVETDYDAQGRPYAVTVPYTGTAGCSYKTVPSCTTPPNTTPALTITTYDALGRPTQVVDGGGGTTKYNYTQTPGSSQVGFDVLVTVNGTPNVVRQYEYDGLGRLTSVCEVNSGSGSGPCLQSVQPNGYWTKYTYDVLNDLLTVSQNTQQGGTQQTRTYTYDGLSRMTSEKNPETNQAVYSYIFDTESGSCNTTYKGDLVKRVDPQGTVTCYAYDALHRLTSATYPTGGYSSVTPSKSYTYDAASGCSATLQYAKGRLAEASTGSSKTTDLCFSYTTRGEVSDVYQSSPHSGGYYHLQAAYWYPSPGPGPGPMSLLYKLSPNMTGIPNWTYTPDGEGRVNTVSASAGQNPVTATSYNGFSEATGVTFGSSDSDALQYDPQTGRMTQYKANVGSANMTGSPTWNANWTLGSLAITDGLNPTDTQTCTYGYDALARLTSAGCGSLWSQTFSYDAFGNITKFGSQPFGPTYSSTTNRYTAIQSVTPTYDSNGNLTYDGFNHYTWDGEGNMASLDSNGETYDALNRRVEQYNGSAYTEIVYGPAGSKLGLMSGQTVTKVFAPLSGGATAVYNSGGLVYYRHPDWLGSSRVASTPSRTLYYDGAYAPFGETYAETGTTDHNFTGKNQDLTPGPTGDLYDFLYREYHKIQGRWVSPDPAGVRAVDPTAPQSWNRYVYVRNNPLNAVDSLGLLLATLCDDQGNCYEVDTDALAGAGFNISTDENGDITGITGPGVDVNLVDSNGNLVGTLNAESTFTLNIDIQPQSVTVSDTEAAVATMGALTLGGSGTYVGPFAATPEQRAIFATAYRQSVHDLGCAGLGWAVAGGSIAASAEVLPKAFSGGGTSGTSVISVLMRGINTGTSIPTPVGTPGTSTFAWRATADLGGAAGRYLPYVGTVAGAAATYACLSSH